MNRFRSIHAYKLLQPEVDYLPGFSKFYPAIRTVWDLSRLDDRLRELALLLDRWLHQPDDVCRMETFRQSRAGTRRKSQDQSQ
jgi:hypothetical protein